LPDPRHAALRTHRPETLLDEPADRVARFGDVAAVGMAVDQGALARAAAEQLVERQPGHLAEDVPERDVDRGDGAHRHRAAAPVRAAIEELEHVLDAAGVA